MCGFVFAAGSRLPDDAALARSMAHIRTRGPDGEGVVRGAGFVLGHTRLAIIDLSVQANQPFPDASGRYLIAFNGEIYNYAELRDDLRARGIALRTHSDTEVLVELIVRDGWRRTAGRLRGMFSFVLLDIASGDALLARDHFGQKPLYWSDEGGLFAAASDPLSIGVLTGRQEPDVDAFSIYASTRSESGTRGLFDPVRSMFAGVHVLPAGHVLERRGGRITVSRYFSPHELYDPALAARMRGESDDALLDELRGLLRQASRRHLVSDVPLGSLLSGGIDSSLVHWYSIEANDDLTAFVKVSPGIETIPQTVVPELLRQRPASAFYQVLKPEAYVLELTAFIAAAHAPTRWGGGPPMYRQCLNARRNGIIVLVGGDCADEVFGGYEHYEKAVAAADRGDLGEMMAIDWNSPHLRRMAAEEYEGREWALRREIEAAVVGEPTDGDAYTQAILLHDMASCLQVCNLANSDTYSMMASVELRNPMLDLDLVRFGINLPPRLKTARHRSGHYGKVLLRELVERDLGSFMQVRKEGTRNYAMRNADPRYWRFDRFQISDMIGRPLETVTKRQVIRLINLEIFHRLFFGGGTAAGEFLPEIMTPAGREACAIPVF